jgi:hypothetical protein
MSKFTQEELAQFNAEAAANFPNATTPGYPIFAVGASFAKGAYPHETEQDAIALFKKLLPGWWYSFGECSVSCHASCGPDLNWQDGDLLDQKLFDEGFHADLRQPSTCAEALLDVMRQGLAARAAAKQRA